MLKSMENETVLAEKAGGSGLESSVLDGEQVLWGAEAESYAVL
jgi:hypothetical protein